MTVIDKSHRLSERKIEVFRQQLLSWYDQNSRDLPWRAKTPESDPYHVWLSEIMLQQTTVAAAGPYFIKFLQKWPDIHALASAHEDEIMKEWAGLGYYARARNLHACAKIVAQDMGGHFPENQDDLKKLPGIGDYTSAAISAIAFNTPATVVDGNIERIIARYFAIQNPLREVKKELKALAAQFFENFNERPGDLAQGLMDLGATVCIPKTPRCGSCPVQISCAARKQGIAAVLPVKAKKLSKPQRFGDVFWIENGNNEVLLHKRPNKGLLGGMAALPTTDWQERKKFKNATPLNNLDNIQPFAEKNTSIYHSFTHFDLELSLKTASLDKENQLLPKGYFWASRINIKDYGFPSVFQKAVNIYLKSV